ncbi:MAG TPA: response regulator, partial [Leptospiraceae bacterium]|nr:response regulator [Leptospiraceae bacterium]
MKSRVLIAEDDAVNGRLLESILGGSEFEATLVSSGEEALRASKENKYDLLVTDLHMPGISGIELVEKLRAEGNPVQAIILTGEEDVSTVVRAMRVGIFDYVPKPVQPE